MPTVFSRRATAAALTAALLVPLAGCDSSDGKGDDGGSGSSDGSGGSGGADGGSAVTLTVLAPTSLTDVLKEAGAAYQKKHPNVRLAFSFAGTEQLAAQVKQGTSADALVTDDQKTMTDAQSKIVGKSSVIARNSLVIAVGNGNPKKIHDLRDLAGAKLKVALAAPEEPAGRYSHQVLDAQHVTVHPAAESPNVRAVLDKVAMGKTDAGLVYKTDIASAPTKVAGVPIPAAQNVNIPYPAGTLKAAGHPKETAAFLTWLWTTEGQKLLSDAGFEKP